MSLSSQKSKEVIKGPTSKTKLPQAPYITMKTQAKLPLTGTVYQE